MATPPFYLTNAHPSAPHSRGQTQDWHWRVAAWVMAISSGDALESRSDEEPSESLPWNIIALMRPVQQQGLWPRFRFFFKKILMVFPSEVFDVMHVFPLAALFMTQYISYFAVRQRMAAPGNVMWVHHLIPELFSWYRCLPLRIWDGCWSSGLFEEMISNWTQVCIAAWAFQEWCHHWTDVWNVS